MRPRDFSQSSVETSFNILLAVCCGQSSVVVLGSQRNDSDSSVLSSAIHFFSIHSDCQGDIIYIHYRINITGYIL